MAVFTKEEYGRTSGGQRKTATRPKKGRKKKFNLEGILTKKRREKGEKDRKFGGKKIEG